jgi:hypothetical protein
MTSVRKISSIIALLGLALGACGSDPSDPVVTSTGNEALLCQSGSLHVEGCPIIKPPPPPPTCTPPGQAKTTSGFSPLYVPETTGYVEAPSFTSLLSGCSVEYDESLTGAWTWASAVCTSAVAAQVTAFADPATAGVTHTCGTDQVVVGWLIGIPSLATCPPNNPGCETPGNGCSTISCRTY